MRVKQVQEISLASSLRVMFGPNGEDELDEASSFVRNCNRLAAVNIKEGDFEEAELLYSISLYHQEKAMSELESPDSQVLIDTFVRFVKVQVARGKLHQAGKEVLRFRTEGFGKHMSATFRDLDMACLREFVARAFENERDFEHAKELRLSSSLLVCGNYGSESCPNPVFLQNDILRNQCHECQSVFYCSKKCMQADYVNRHNKVCTNPVLETSDIQVLLRSRSEVFLRSLAFLLALFVLLAFPLKFRLSL